MRLFANLFIASHVAWVRGCTAHAAGSGPWLEDLPFYEQAVHKTVAYLHDQGLGQGPFPGKVQIPGHLFTVWCYAKPGTCQGQTPSTSAIGMVVMTAVCFENTRVQYINRTWGRYFPRLIFVSGDTPDVANAQIVRITAPPEFLKHFALESYMSHVYKGHMGLDRFFCRHPDLPWYGLVSDDSYVFEPYLAKILESATLHPGRDAVCVGHLQRQPKDVHWAVFQQMFRLCEQFAGFGEEWVDLCKEKAGILRLPFVNVTYAHGAGIFCSNAAMALLQPHLSNVMSAGVFEQFAPQFTDFIQPADELLGRCIAELGIRLVDMHGYYAGSHVPGTVPNDKLQLPEFREGLPKLSLASATRPALWHEIREPMQFDALEFFYLHTLSLVTHH